MSAQIYAFYILETLKVVTTFLSKTKISLAVYTKNSDWRLRTEIMQVIYFLFALIKKFQCLFEMISVSFYLCNLCLCEFLYRICWMKIIQTLEIIETQHFDTSNYITNRRSPSSKSNTWTITISVYFFNIWLKYSWAKK